MIYDDSPGELEFREGLRSWLKGHNPGPPPPLWETDALHAYRMRWLRELYDAVFA